MRVGNESGQSQFNASLHDRVVYVRDMLGEFRSMVDADSCEMLCYLIEMAYLEAGDWQMENSAEDDAD